MPAVEPGRRWSYGGGMAERIRKIRKALWHECKSEAPAVTIGGASASFGWVVSFQSQVKIPGSPSPHFWSLWLILFIGIAIFGFVVWIVRAPEHHQRALRQDGMIDKVNDIYQIVTGGQALAASPSGPMTSGTTGSTGMFSTAGTYTPSFIAGPTGTPIPDGWAGKTIPIRPGTEFQIPTPPPVTDDD